MNSFNLNDKDKLILAELQKDCKQSVRALGKKLRMPPTTISQRINRLIKNKVIKSFSAIIDPEKVGLPTTAFVLVRRTPARQGAKVKYSNIGDTLAKFPEIQEVYLISGEHDALVKLRGRNEKQLGSWVVDTLWNVPDVERTLTFFVFNTTKETHEINLK